MMVIPPYISRVSPLHTADPRSKFALFLAIMTISLIFSSPVVMTAIAICVIMFWWVAKIPLRILFRYSKFLLYLSLLIILTQGLFYGQAPLLTIIPNFLVVKSDGLLLGCAVGLRIFAIFMMVPLITMTSRLADIMAALSKMHLPFVLSFAVSAVIRFIPLLAEEGSSIIEAQKARGLDLDRMGPVKKARAYFAVLFPLLYQALLKAESLALTLEARGFTSKGEKTFLRSLRLTVADKLMISLSVLSIPIAVFVRVVLDWGS